MRSSARLRALWGDIYTKHTEKHNKADEKIAMKKFTQKHGDAPGMEERGARYAEVKST
jgi:hypothetical protein